MTYWSQWSYEELDSLRGIEPEESGQTLMNDDDIDFEWIDTKNEEFEEQENEE